MSHPASPPDETARPPGTPGQTDPAEPTVRHFAPGVASPRQAEPVDPFASPDPTRAFGAETPLDPTRPFAEPAPTSVDLPPAYPPPVPPPPAFPSASAPQPYTPPAPHQLAPAPQPYTPPTQPAYAPPSSGAPFTPPSSGAPYAPPSSGAPYTPGGLYSPPPVEAYTPPPPVRPAFASPYAPPPGYPLPQPYQQVVMAVAPPTSGWAVASLVLGIVGLLGGWCAFGIPCLLAVIFGHVGYNETRRGAKSGKGLAVAGLVMGYICLLPTILFTIWVIGAGTYGAAFS